MGCKKQTKPKHPNSARQLFAQKFQNSFCQGRVNRGIGDIANEANFFIQANKDLFINREKFNKILKVFCLSGLDSYSIKDSKSVFVMVV